MKLNFKIAPHKKTSDEKLMAFVQNGNTEAFNEIYRRYNKRLLYYFYRMLGNDQALAEDFLQDLFLKIIDKAHYFKPDKKFSTWIFSVAHNQCKNEYRNREVRRNNVVYDTCEIQLSEEEDSLASSIQPELIFNALQEFDENHRTAFLLKYREGLDIKEISEILEIPEGTIKSRLFYTRKKLQLQLKKHLTD